MRENWNRRVKTASHIFTTRKCSDSVSFRMEERTSVVNVTPPWRKTFDFQMMQEDITFGQECFRKAILVVGLFLNGTVLLVVSCSRQLRYPRHIFWAVISFFECLFLLQCALELAIVFNQDQLACQIFIVLAPVVYSILLLILSMAALDRYLAIVRYECTNWVDMYWVLLWDLSLGVTCVILHFKIFYESRTLIQQYLPNYHQQSVTVKFVNSRSGNSNFGFGSVEPKPVPEKISVTFAEHSAVALNENDACLHSDNFRLPPAISHLDTEFFPWMKNRSKISRLEVRAALNMSVNILPFWLCTFPVSCVIISLYWCIRLEGDCDMILRALPYVWSSFQLHSVYNPAMYMCTSSEFWRAFLHMKRKLTNPFHIHKS
ncbi:uncharacterized protein LOC124202521 isoform X2 [Daphnia pulex]|uniref:uncharacterized protein LOC124202521 isoform X2 n=1 Tax=Daphnia pulex TaxID=6669 RepID=UPI001EE0411D|nr:uncharacterized protein LOC124202521 isoform X2 [Daphnia pulex]